MELLEFNKKQVSIIIVNYNKYELTQKCIASIFNNVNDIEYEIIVVDNCSTNESYEVLKSFYIDNERVSVINTEHNNGFGDGNNFGVSNCKYKNILLLNPDVILMKNSLKKMLDKLESDEKIGLLGCKLLNGDLTLQYSCRRFIPFNEFILARTPIKKIVSRKKVEKINNKYLMKDYDHMKEKEVDWIMGSCLMLRKEDFLKVKGFSKEYFMYFEDVDLCYKLIQIGKKVVYYPKCEMIHLHEQASSKKINKLSFIHLSSMFKFYKKYYLNKLKR